LSRNTIVVNPTETTSIKFSVYNGNIAPFASAPLLKSIDCLDGDPFTLVSQINKEVKSGETLQSQAVLKATNSGGVDTVCSICEADLLSSTGLGYCTDVRVTIK